MSTKKFMMEIQEQFFSQEQRNSECFSEEISVCAAFPY